MDNSFLGEKISDVQAHHTSYDVVIVGAGIGGLVCGCYLAKAGLKVLIIEKNNKVGGYCSSFEMKGFRFDAGVHGIGGMHPRGAVHKLINDLSLALTFDEKDPAESIFYLNKYFINFWKDSSRTCDEFTAFFPKEKIRIQEFFDMVLNCASMDVFARFRNMSFFDVLRQYFVDEDLISIFGIPLGNIGINSEICSALAGITFYREFLLNPHVYPAGGMQSFSDALLDKFLSFQGTLTTCKQVSKIIDDASGHSIICIDGNAFKAKAVVLNLDPFQAQTILHERSAILQLKKIIQPFIFSMSSFFVNIGSSKKIDFKFRDKTVNNLWFFPEDDTASVFLSKRRLDLGRIIKSKSIFISFPTANTARLLVLAPFLDNSYWKRNKQSMTDVLFKRAYNVFGDSLGQADSVISVATPQDLHKYTFNHSGSCYGWATTKLVNNQFSKFLKLNNNMFLCGHWVPNSFGCGGVSSVVHSGYLCSSHIVNKWSEING